MYIILKTQASAWSDALWTGKEPLISDLAEIFSGLSSSAIRLEKLGDDKDKDGLNIDTKKENCLIFLTQYLLQNILEFMEELEETPL